MLDTPQIVDSAEEFMAKISLAVPRDQIQTVMGPGIGEVFKVLAAQGIAPAGPWFTHHRRRPTETFDFDICVPVATPVSAEGRVQPERLASCRVARTIYKGPYEGLGAAWGEFCNWIESNGHAPRADLWERYLIGPETGCEPSDYVTELNRPLVDA